jgi:hypothetical protein
LRQAPREAGVNPAAARELVAELTADVARLTEENAHLRRLMETYRTRGREEMDRADALQPELSSLKAQNRHLVEENARLLRELDNALTSCSMLTQERNQAQARVARMREVKPAERVGIVFDGEAWFLRAIRLIEHDLDRDEKVYRCGRPIGTRFETLADAVAALAEPRRPA